MTENTCMLCHGKHFQTILTQGIDNRFGKPGKYDVKQCVHCGLCLEACPTYALFRTEMDSPRGRITLMRALDDGLFELDGLNGSFKEHLTLCLSCLACESACPSGVQYGKLIEIVKNY